MIATSWTGTLTNIETEVLKLGRGTSPEPESETHLRPSKPEFLGERVKCNVFVISRNPIGRLIAMAGLFHGG